MKVAVIALVGAAFAFPASKTTTEAPTFYKDVLPILQKNCQSCHRAGEAAPMSFMSYNETRPWAKAIKEAVRTRRMPPWFADPHVGKFANDRSLSSDQVDLVSRWADAGAPEGMAKDGPAPLPFLDGWNIGQPEYTVQMPVEFTTPKEGTIEYTYFVIPTGFEEDKWVQLAEVRPGNRRIVHHVIAFIREPGSQWLKEAKPGEPFVAAKRGRDSAGSLGGEFLVGYAPGTVPEHMAPGQAKLIKAGSDIVLQMHYTANGKAETDRTTVGFIFAKEPPMQRVLTLAVGNTKFVIPPRADNHRVEATLELREDTTLMSMLPHMHLRGKAFEYRVVYPTGERQDLLRVPKYDFNWQLSYFPSTPVALPKGTRIEATAWYDNSANNPANPDPDSEVRYGEQSWEEMMFGFFNVAFDPKVDPAHLVQSKKKQAGGD